MRSFKNLTETNEKLFHFNKVERMKFALAFPLPYLRMMKTANITSLLKKDGADDVYKAIKKCPLYTRNAEMEVRVFEVIYLFDKKLYGKNKRSQEFINLASLLTFIDCIADTIADEFESLLVQQILEGNDFTQKLKSAENILCAMQESLLLSIDGQYKWNMVLDQAENVSNVMEELSTYVKNFFGKNKSREQETVIKEIKEGIIYMFQSHFESLQLRKDYLRNTYVTPIGEHLTKLAGATNYYAVFYTILYNKLHDPRIRAVVNSKAKWKKLKQVSKNFSEADAFGNGYKSFKREFVEGDYSSWVYNYLMQKSGKENTKKINENIAVYTKSNLQNKEAIRLVLASMDLASLASFFRKETIRRIKEVIHESKGILPDSYVLLLLTIIRLEVHSGIKEEGKQIEDFLNRLE